MSNENKNMENKNMENQNPVPENPGTPDANPKKVGFLGKLAGCVKKGFNWVIEIPTRHTYAAEFVTLVCSMAAGGAAMVYTMDKVAEHDAKKKSSAMPAATNKPIIDVTATEVPTPVQIPEIDVAPVSEIETVESPVQILHF